MSDRRVRIATLAVGALLLAGGIGAVQLLYLRPAHEWKQRLAALESALRHEQAAAAQRPLLEADVAQLAARLGGEVERLPGEPHLDAFVAEAGRHARARRLRIVRLQPGEPRAEAGVQILPVQLAVEGDFPRIYSWMMDLEQAPRLARVEVLRASRTTTGGVHAELTVALYMGRKLPGE